MIDSSMASNMTSPDDAFSREVTEANWKQNQTIKVAARSDFLYDGSQTRNLTLTLRKEVGGQTVERRTVAYFIVSDCLALFHNIQNRSDKLPSFLVNNLQVQKADPVNRELSARLLFAIQFMKTSKKFSGSSLGVVIWTSLHFLMVKEVYVSCQQTIQKGQFSIDADDNSC